MRTLLLQARGCSCRPLPGAEDDYELVGLTTGADGDARRGQKQLRTLLCATREWASEPARNQLADALEAAGDATLAGELRGKRSARLTKGHMFALARAWGYQSSLWYRHGRASRKRAAAGQPPGNPAGESKQLRPASPSAILPRRAAASDVSSSSAEQRMERQLRELSLAASQLLAGPSAQRAAQAPGAPGFFCERDCAELERGASLLAASAAAWAALPPPPCDEGAQARDTPAWLFLRGARTAVELRLEEDAALLRLWACANCAIRWFAAPELLEALRRGEVALPDFLEPPGEEEGAATVVAAPAGGAESFEPLSQPRAAAAAVWLYEMYCAVTALSELCVRLRASVARARATGTPASYAASGALAAAVMVEAYTQSSAALGARVAWMRQQLAEAPGEGEGDAQARRLLFQIPAPAPESAPA